MHDTGRQMGLCSKMENDGTIAAVAENIKQRSDLKMVKRKKFIFAS